MALVISRFDVWLVALDPAQGAEMRKTRPCVVVSPDEMNRHIDTVIIAPMTSQRRAYPTRVTLTFRRKRNEIVLDQLRTIDKNRLVRKLGKLDPQSAEAALAILQEMFAR